ncbi:MAG: hypothetical protein VKL20_00175 [Synechocystis sp.]|nr:hypothetical protein [Synechocystis sp.]
MKKMQITDLEHLQIPDLASFVTGGFFVSRSGFKVSDFKFFPGVGFGAYRASFKAIARGGKKAFTGGYAKGKIYKTRYGVVSVSSSRAYASAEG